MKKLFLSILLFLSINSILFAQLYISEVSDAGASSNEYLEIYNNSNSQVDLTGYKLIRVNASTNQSEYVYDFGTDESNGGDVIIPAKGFLVIARGATKSNFESEWGNLPAGVAYNSGNSNLYFGSGTARRWRLRGNDGTANQDNGTLYDDTGQAVGGSGNRHYQKSIGGPWVQASYSTATPGYFDGDQSLPISLNLFNAVGLYNSVKIYWETQSEIDNAGFEIVRSESRDGEYETIASYVSNPNLRGQGNSTGTHRYEFIDENVSPGHTYWYKLVDVDFNGHKTFHGPISATVPMESNPIYTVSSNLPKNFRLYPNYPNPFNPTTTLKFDIPDLDHGAPVEVSLVIYNSLGEVVKEFYHGKLPAGVYQAVWDGRNAQGVSLPSGIYYAVLRADYFSSTVKMILLK